MDIRDGSNTGAYVCHLLNCYDCNFLIAISLTFGQLLTGLCLGTFNRDTNLQRTLSLLGAYLRRLCYSHSCPNREARYIKRVLKKQEWQRERFLTAAARVFQRCFPLFVVLWILFVLYPNPANLIISVQRVFSPDVDPDVVGPLLGDFPSEPTAIEKAVVEKIPYSYDWQVHGMPWYFPTTKTVLEKGRGDCKARAIVLASVLEGKHIPYRISSSPIHVWVEYEGKAETSLENPEVKFYQRDPETGERFFQIPDIGLREVMNSTWRGFWEPMPEGRKVLLLSGVFILAAIRVLLYQNRAKGIDKIQHL